MVMVYLKVIFFVFVGFFCRGGYFIYRGRASLGIRVVN